MFELPTVHDFNGKRVRHGAGNLDTHGVATHSICGEYSGRTEIAIGTSCPRSSPAFATSAGSPTEREQNSLRSAAFFSPSSPPAPASEPVRWQCTRCQGPMRVVERLITLQIFFPQARWVPLLDSS